MRLIDAEIQKILDYLDNELHPLVSPDHWDVYSELYDMVSELENLPPSPTPSRPKGHWIRWYETLEDANCVEHIPKCKCSECGTEYDPHSSQFINFCSHCGADMRGTEHE